MSTSAEIKKGLEGVVVTDSTICVIDGQEGSLRYRGIDISDLAQHSTYEETVYLLWFGELPNRAQLDAFKAELAGERELGDSVRNVLAALPGDLQPMEALRTIVSVLSCCDPDAADNGREANLRKAVRLTARLPTLVAYHYCHSTGAEWIPPDPDLGHAANFLYMLRGERPTLLEERAMDLSLVLMAEHGMNASTFAGRITASTLSDMYSAITSAIGTLKGPLHGGANQRAMEMLLEIGDLDNVEPYITLALAAKKRIMGFGHRVYRSVIDPRSAHLQDMLHKLCVETGDLQWCQLALAVAEVVAEKKGLYPNVDFFTGPLLYLLGVPMDLFTPIFAVSRIAGWAAHLMEQYENNRLLRPLSNYVGPLTRPYVPIERRNGRVNSNMV